MHCIRWAVLRATTSAGCCGRSSVSALAGFFAPCRLWSRMHWSCRRRWGSVRARHGRIAGHLLSSDPGRLDWLWQGRD